MNIFLYLRNFKIYRLWFSDYPIRILKGFPKWIFFIVQLYCLKYGILQEIPTSFVIPVFSFCFISCIFSLFLSSLCGLFTKPYIKERKLLYNTLWVEGLIFWYCQGQWDSTPSKKVVGFHTWLLAILISFFPSTSSSTCQFSPTVAKHPFLYSMQGCLF